MAANNHEHFKEYLERELFTPPHGSEKEFIGVEVECFAHNTLKNRPEQVFRGADCVAQSIIQASPNCTVERVVSNEGEQIIDKINFVDGDQIRFEPGGQIEIITSPCSSFADLNIHLTSKQNLLNKIAVGSNLAFQQYGTNTRYTAADIGLQLKLDRYQSMMDYFDKIGPYGKRMMLQTCTMHVNLDLGIDDHTMLKRYVVSNLLAPFTSAIFANSSIIEGKKTDYKSYRNLIWQKLDPLRSGNLPLEKIVQSWSKEALLDSYLDFSLAAPLIYTKSASSKVLPQNYTMNYWLSNAIDGHQPNESDYDQHLSLLFPTVRLKGYLEIRSLDVPPIEWQLVPPIFYSGLLYSNEYLDKTLDLLLPIHNDLPKYLNDSLYGLDSDKVYSISKKLIEYAIDGFSSLSDSIMDEDCLNKLIRFADEFTLQRKTFADKHYQ